MAVGLYVAKWHRVRSLYLVDLCGGRKDGSRVHFDPNRSVLEDVVNFTP